MKYKQASLTLSDFFYDTAWCIVRSIRWILFLLRLLLRQLM